MADQSMQALNQLVALLHRSMQQHAGRDSRGASQLSNWGKYGSSRPDPTGGGNLRSQVEQAIKDGDIEHIDALSSVIDASKEQLREAENIAARFASEKEQAKLAVDDAMAPYFNAIYKDSDLAKQQYEMLCESENVVDVVAEISKRRLDNDGEFRKRMKNIAGDDVPMRGVARIREDIIHKLETKGIDIQSEGGQRIYARELMKEMPELFGSIAGSKTLMESADRKAAKQAIKDFTPDAPELIALEEKLSLSTHNAELTEAQLERIKGNIKTLEDRRDMAKMDRLEAALRAQLGEPEPELTEDERALDAAGAEMPIQGELDFGENQSVVIEGPEVEPEREAAALSAEEAPAAEAPKVEKEQTQARPAIDMGLNIDAGDVFSGSGGAALDIEGVNYADGVDLGDDVYNIKIDRTATPPAEDDLGPELRLNPEDRIGGAPVAKGPGRLERLKNGIVNRFAAAQEQVDKFVKDTREGVVRKYQEVKGNMQGRLLSLSASPQARELKIDPTFDVNDPNIQHIDDVPQPTIDEIQIDDVPAGTPELEAEVEAEAEYYYEPPAVNHDRIMQMREVYNADDLEMEEGTPDQPRSAYFRAQVEREVAKFKDSPDGTAVPYKHADGRSEVIPAHLTPVLREVEQMEGFEAGQGYAEKQPADLAKVKEKAEPQPHKERSAQRMRRRRNKRPQPGGIRVGYMKV